MTEYGGKILCRRQVHDASDRLSGVCRQLKNLINCRNLSVALKDQVIVPESHLLLEKAIGKYHLLPETVPKYILKFGILVGNFYYKLNHRASMPSPFTMCRHFIQEILCIIMNSSCNHHWKNDSLRLWVKMRSN